jgi:hypothetical protein
MRVLALVAPIALTAYTRAQEVSPSEARLQPTSPQAQAEAAPATGAESFPAEHLEQLVAPIALYPDGLLAQILMAATYPLEIVEAARWLQKNPGLKADALETKLKDQTWDPSVKSLCGFPDVLARMNDNLDWTQDLGDAFLAQQAELMDAVQNMRRKAYDSGNLKSGKEQTVTEQPDKIIVIEAADPEVIYVPTYYPTAVYGSWSYPYWYYPPMYPPAPPGGMFFAFSAGVVWGAAVWGGCGWGWGHTEVDIDVNRYNNFVDNTEINARRGQAKDKVGSGGKWQHSPENRKGVGYRDTKTAQQYGGSPGETRVSRDQARGYGDRGTTRGGTQPSTRDAGRAGAATRPSAGASDRSASTRASGQRSGSYSGARSPSLDKASSKRGSTSRSSAGSRGASRGGGGRGGGRR